MHILTAPSFFAPKPSSRSRTTQLFSWHTQRITLLAFTSCKRRAMTSCQLRRHKSMPNCQELGALHSADA
jgi:hypothetical protein